MRSSKTILTFLIVFAVAQFCLAQEKPQPVLSDKWVKVYCEDNLNHLDFFFMELQNHPGASGYIIIYYGDDSFAERFENENQIMGHAEFRKFDIGRLKIVSVNRGDKNAEIEFWRIPQGADLPVPGSEVREELNIPAKAFVFGYPGPLCPMFSSSLYKAYIEKHPDLRGHVVIFGETMKEARKNGKYWLDILAESSIPRDRLRIFYSTAKTYLEAEFWLVPAKKK